MKYFRVFFVTAFMVAASLMVGCKNNDTGISDLASEVADSFTESFGEAEWKLSDYLTETEKRVKIYTSVTTHLMQNTGFPIEIEVSGEKYEVKLSGIETDHFQNEIMKVMESFFQTPCDISFENRGNSIEIVALKDGKSIQELLLASGLVTMSDSLPEGYEDAFMKASDMAIKEKRSMYSDYSNAGWLEEDEDAFTMYSTGDINVRAIPTVDSDVIGKLSLNEEVTVVSHVTSFGGEDTDFYCIEGESPMYVAAALLSPSKTVILDNPVVAVPDNPTENYQLDVDLILQNPELPNGCEVTSLTIALRYAGYDVDKCELSDNYLPKWPDLTGDPEEYFLREPRTNGFYCFQGALETCIDNYNAANGTTIIYENLGGEEPEALYEKIREGHPVIVWGTLHWRRPYENEAGLYTNLHCMVLAGYTDTTVTIIDPIYGNAYRTIDRENFETVYRLMNKRAMTAY